MRETPPVFAFVTEAQAAGIEPFLPLRNWTRGAAYTLPNLTGGRDPFYVLVDPRLAPTACRAVSLAGGG